MHANTVAKLKESLGVIAEPERVFAPSPLKYKAGLTLLLLCSVFCPKILENILINFAKIIKQS
tara:strand:+ start:49 stop:237 length:189 start_codon:yes stop_codon:yes gene_type:complete